ncbi:MAG: HD domain-containing protein, partial [Bacteroidia bacterium]
LGGKLDLCIRIFTDTYPKRFLHRLVSSQLDMDRLDYLNRDSFFTGVVEGTVGAERIIKMLDVANDEIVVQEKGIYSIEKFLVARRLMYWQVYLHKTVLSAENMLVGMLRRARELAQNGQKLFASQALEYFIQGTNFSENTDSKQEFLAHFARLDDYDIFAAAKEWMLCGDLVLSELSTRLIERNLFRIHLDIAPFAEDKVQLLSDAFLRKGFSRHEASYFVFTGEITNSAYKDGEDNILIVQKNGAIVGLDEAAGQLQLHLSTEATRKYFLCYPKELDYLFN